MLERCSASVEAHGGRIFSTAGDAVMMEFASVAAGLEAAAELAANPDPPIRVGVHLGEVTVQPSGDLLGHGVNVAARIQSQARPGSVLVSEDARRAVRGPLARRLMSKGVIKLDKIDESIGVYELTAEDHAAPPVDVPQRNLRRWRYWALAAGAVATLVALIVWVSPLLNDTPRVRVALFSAAAGQSSDAETLTNGVADDVALALNALSIEMIGRAETAQGTRAERMERARALGADLVLEGAAETGSGALRLTMNVIRTSDSTTLWSNAFEAGADEFGPLRGRAAEVSADVLSCTVRVMRDRRKKIESATLALLLRGCAARRGNETLLEVRDRMQSVIERDPDIPYARALLALSSVIAAGVAPETMQPELLQSARTEAERAIRADPNIGESYLALSLLEPLENWSARESLLRTAIDRDEHNGTAYNFYSNFLTEIGREAEALAFAERALALDPLSRSKRRNYAYALAMNGRHDEARAFLAEMGSVWAEDQLWRARLRIALASGAFDEAASLLRTSNALQQPREAQACWRHVLDAYRNITPANVQRVRACDSAGRLSTDVHDRLLVTAGDLDGLFALTSDRPLAAEAMFAPETASLRQDGRFMPLMRDLGLLSYWQTSNRWPDFCREPSLPYRCQAEAQRLL